MRGVGAENSRGPAPISSMGYVGGGSSPDHVGRAQEGVLIMMPVLR